MSLLGAAGEASLAAFDHQPRTRLVFGVGAAARIGVLVRDLGAGRALVVTDPGVARAGHAEQARASLAAAGVEASIHADVRENPTPTCVDACARAARERGAEALVAVGGGSSIDTARAAAMVLGGGGPIEGYEGYAKVPPGARLLPLVAAPTTGGTGSECQSYALIACEKTHRKMACGDPRAAARVAVLDPALTATQPRTVTAHTGLDALVHAVETAVTTKRSPLSLLYAFEAFRRLHAHLPRVLAEPLDLDARGHVQLGAAFAGLAIEASMLGAAHAAANPLTARYGVVHGQAVAVMLPAVIRYNAAEPAALEGYAELARAGALADRETPTEAAVAALAARIGELIAIAGVPQRLRDHGVDEGALPALAEDAAQQWTGRFNPRPIARAGFEALYRDALGKGR